MSDVFVRRLHARDEIAEPWWKEIWSLEEEVRQTAQRLYETRESLPHEPADDWVRAERQVCWAPQAELKETDNSFRVRLGIPGLHARDIEVTLLPETIIVQGKSIRDSDGKARIHFSEFGSGALFRKIPIPAAVQVDSAVVTFEKNLLEISAAKMECGEAFAGALAASN
jgi:HSP20 family molecular chaperone IbpA